MKIKVEKMKKLWKEDETSTNLLIKADYYEEINHLMNNWSSNWVNNSFNLRTITEDNKKNAMTRIAISEQY